MLQVKDAQEVFDENIRPLFVQAARDIRQELDEEDLNTPYSIFVLGEMYGTVSTCLAQNIPIPKGLWDMPVVRSFVRGDVDDVFYADKIDDNGNPSKELYTYTNSPIVRGDVDDVVVVDERKNLLEQVADIVRAEMPDMEIEVVYPNDPIGVKMPSPGSSVENKGLIVIP